MEQRDDAARTDVDIRPVDADVPETPPVRDEELGGARDALRATPNQHRFDDADPGDDAARNYHGVDDGA